MLLSTEQLVHWKIISASKSDIAAIAATFHSKYLGLNASKCCYLFLSRRKSCSIPPPQLMFDGLPLKRVDSYKYLGIQITSDLMWSSHILNICNKTRLIGIMYRQFYEYSSSNTLLKLYTSFIRPNLEYVSITWDPHLKDITLLDVQKFALKVCTKLWDYNTLLPKSCLPSLQARHDQAKLYNLYNIINELTSSRMLQFFEDQYYACYKIISWPIICAHPK